MTDQDLCRHIEYLMTQYAIKRADACAYLRALIGTEYTQFMHMLERAKVSYVVPDDVEYRVDVNPQGFSPPTEFYFKENGDLDCVYACI